MCSTARAYGVAKYINLPKIQFLIITDVNECEKAKAEGKQLCQHNCVNTIGSYFCSCRPGFKLDATKRKCLGKFNIRSDLNEFCFGIAF